MAHDPVLEQRIRDALSSFRNVEEQHKMGGVSFLLNKKMCIRAHQDGGLMLRCDPEMTDEYLGEKGVKRFEMKGKTMMKGWLLVSGEYLKNKKDLDFWVTVATGYTEKMSKPVKKKKKSM